MIRSLPLHAGAFFLRSMIDVAADSHVMTHLWLPHHFVITLLPFWGFIARSPASC
jgi:hypothetical protein